MYANVLRLKNTFLYNILNNATSQFIDFQSKFTLYILHTQLSNKYNFNSLSLTVHILQICIPFRQSKSIVVYAWDFLKRINFFEIIIEVFSWKSSTFAMRFCRKFSKPLNFLCAIYLPFLKATAQSVYGILLYFRNIITALEGWDM